MILGPRIVAAVLVVAVGAVAVAQPPREKRKTVDLRSLELKLDANLKDVINHGARVYNHGDPAGCCRVYEGALLSVRPLLEERPRLLGHVLAALDHARSEPSCIHRAFLLRKALDQIRDTINPPRDGDLTPKAIEGKLPQPTRDGKKIEEKGGKKIEEGGKKIEDDSKKIEKDSKKIEKELEE
jgi:hypothetical protein